MYELSIYSNVTFNVTPFSKAIWYMFRTGRKIAMTAGRYGTERDMKSPVQAKLSTI